ncbi:anti-sigma B factor antagonist [Frigoribacterium sp. PvP120]|uniref:STAS domain-containing protein n=1 Tax=unclassified Frigoribacterium TaxID=2627005 RepID=UPI001AEB0CAD|nr:STAS domain-containing protein [Frigoribacterium sp. PvP121]MBP1240685.1 anti-sigma B factor antagonist [Frigoribacterium sp. PvP121]
MDLAVEGAGADVAVVRCTGRLNMVSAPALREAVTGAIAEGRPRVVVDLAGVDFMDSSGLGALVGCLKSARSAGGDLRIASPSAQVLMVLKLSNIDRILRPHDDAATAFDE